MRKYIEHIKNTRTPHQRRTHALQAAGLVTAAIFVVWAGTLGVRLASPSTVAQNDNGTQTTLSQSDLTASAAAAQQQNAAHLEVSTTSIYSN